MFEVIELGGMKTVKSNSATNHVYLVDVSGSMYGSLPKMRQHLKNIVSMVAQPDDTFTVIYFSGRGQCGVVCECVPVGDLASVTSVQQAIDRWLTPIGLTGFAEPMELAVNVASKFDNDKYNNFVMLTDGYDNQSNRTQIVEDARALPSVYQSVSFIEYGWYCDRELLAKMAEASGGVHVFAEGYDEYEVTFDDVVSGAVRESRVTVDINKKAKHAIYTHNDRIFIAEVSDGQVSVPESVERVHSIVPGDVLQKHLSDDHLYLIMYYAAKTGNSKLVWRCLEATGDIRLIDLYTNAFTRQELTHFTEVVENAVLYPDERGIHGVDTDYLPPEDAITVMDVLKVLDQSDVKIVVDSPYFEYAKIGQSRVAEEDLPRFVKTPGQYASITGLTYNSSRPNVSIQTLIQGSVELPENDFNLKRVPSHQWRNYTIIRDGILNTKALPVLINQETLAKLDSLDDALVDVVEDGESVYAVLNLDVMPVINRKMSMSPDVNVFAEMNKELIEYQAYIKGLKSCLSEKDAKAETLAKIYGEEAAKWLSSIGIRDYGFSPVGTKGAETSDFYYATDLETKIKGLNSLPSANAVQKKIDNGKKFTVSEYLVSIGMKEGSDLSDDELKTTIKAVNQTIKDVQAQLSSIVYSMIIGKTWFKGVDDDEVTVNLNFDQLYDVPMNVKLVRREIKI